jgi:hypothetical protein
MISETNQKLYGYPDMGRTGLGHSLLAWARCAVWCRDTGAIMLAPRWLRVRVGPYLRGERDKRDYFKLFQKGDYLHEPQRGWLLLTADKLYAELDLPAAKTKFRHNTVVVFRNAMSNNEKKMFHFVEKDGRFLRDEFLKMVRPEFIPAPAAEPFIAAHVRMGDFRLANIDDLKAGVTNSRLPVEWYADVACRLRSQLGREAPLVVISDGPDDALAPLLSLPNARRTPKQESVADMLTISQASALIASYSGFSHWGAVFGEVPRITFPSQVSVKLPQPDVECDFGQSLPDDFIEAVYSRLTGAQG